VTSLGFVEYFDSIMMAIAEMLTQYDTAKRSRSKCTQSLEIIKTADILHI